MDLNTYIRQLLSQGYTPAQIREVLLKYQYPEQVIDRALYSSEVKHTHHLAPVTIAIILVMVVGIGVTGYFLYHSFFQAVSPTQLLDVSFSTKTQAAPGDMLSLSVSLINMGSKKTFDVALKAELFDSTQNRVNFKSETVALESTKSHAMNLAVPDGALSGQYSVKVTARYGSQIAEAEQQISVKSPESRKASCFDTIQNQDETGVDCGGSCKACQSCPENCDDANSETTDYCTSTTNYQCKHDKQSSCGDGSCQPGETTNSCLIDCPVASTPWEELKRIENIQDMDEAKRECEKISSSFRDQCLKTIGQRDSDATTCASIQNEFDRDKCLKTVAADTKNKVLCEQISKESRRNVCYLNIALAGDYSVCESITDKYQRSSCNVMKNQANEPAQT